MFVARGTRITGALLLAALWLPGCGGEEPTTGSTGASLSATPEQRAPGRNEAPVVESVRFDPADPRPGQPLHARVRVNDPDGDAVRVLFEWRVNGAVVDPRGHGEFATDELERGDEIEVVVRATDGQLESEPRSARARAANRAPVLETVWLLPEGVVRPGQEVRAAADAFDPDGDQIALSYEWLVNGDRRDGQGERFSTEGLRRGDRLAVRVVARDREDASPAQQSPVATLANSPPVFRGVPRPEEKDGTFVYQFEATDPDGDRRLRFRLAEAPPGMQIDPVLGTASWRPDASAAGVHPVEVVVQDASGDASALRFELRVSAEAEAPPAAAAP